MDLVCVDHCFTYIGYGSDHDGSGSDHGTSGSDHDGSGSDHGTSGSYHSRITLTTHRPLPRYKGKQIDNTDLLDSIDRVGTKLAETLALVSAIQSQPNEQVTTPHNRSTRLARASRPA